MHKTHTIGWIKSNSTLIRRGSCSYKRRYNRSALLCLAVFTLFIFRSQIYAQEKINFDRIQSKTIGPPVLSIKTNLLYDATTTFNLGVEFKVGPRYTLDLSTNYNPWTFSDNKKLKHILVQPELRYWLCEPFYGHFFGFHGIYSHYNVGNIDLPLDIYPSLKDSRYQGNLYGAGFSYGYQWLLSPRWSVEATIGFGYIYADYKRYDYKCCGEFRQNGRKHYIGPTKAGLSLIYIIK